MERPPRATTARHHCKAACQRVISHHPARVTKPSHTATATERRLSRTQGDVKAIQQPSHTHLLHDACRGLPRSGTVAEGCVCVCGVQSASDTPPPTTEDPHTWAKSFPSPSIKPLNRCRYGKRNAKPRMRCCRLLLRSKNCTASKATRWLSTPIQPPPASTQPHPHRYALWQTGVRNVSTVRNTPILPHTNERGNGCFTAVSRQCSAAELIALANAC